MHAPIFHTQNTYIFHAHLAYEVNATNQEPGMKQMESNLRTSEAYGSLRVFISENRTIGLNDPIVRPEVVVW